MNRPLDIGAQELFFVWISQKAPEEKELVNS